jgi:hypothetical protein
VFRYKATFTGTISEIDSPLVSLALISVAEISIRGAEINVELGN